MNGRYTAQTGGGSDARNCLPPGRMKTKIICVCHDIEGPVDTPVEDAHCRDNLLRMLEIEEDLGVAGTYNVLGMIWNDRVPVIVSRGRHALGFHSYNHQIEDVEQLPRCRPLNSEVRGYRPPRSRITPELTGDNLRAHGIVWLLSSVRSFGFTEIRLEENLVKIPVHQDDHPLYAGRIGFDEWEAKLYERLESTPCLAFGLHDCYAHLWLDRYRRILERLAGLGEFWTCDRLANCCLEDMAH